MNLTTKITKTDIARIMPHMTNWMPVHAYIRHLPVDENSLLELRRMLTIELNREEPRAQILERLYGKFSAMRKQMEERDIFGRMHTTTAPPETA